QTERGYEAVERSPARVIDEAVLDEGKRQAFAPQIGDVVDLARRKCEEPLVFIEPGDAHDCGGLPVAARPERGDVAALSKEAGLVVVVVSVPEFFVVGGSQ